MPIDEPFKPGDSCLETGIYRVFHDQHRLPHEVVVLRGDSFPRCAKCTEGVSFVLFYSAPMLLSTFKDVLPVIDDDEAFSATTSSLFSRGCAESQQSQTSDF